MMVSTRVPMGARFTAGAASSALVLLFLASLMLSLTLMGATADGAVDDPPLSGDAIVLAVEDDEASTDAGADDAVDADADADAEAVLAEVEVTYEAFLNRDPFESVRPEPPADATDGGTGDGGTGDGGTGDGGTGTDGTGDGGTGDGDTGDGGAGDGGTGAGDDDGCRTNGEAVCDGKVITLLEIDTDGDRPLAIIQVDEVVYSVAVGDRFADDFRLTSLQLTPPCVTLMYGDEVFELCVGDSTQK